MAKKASSLLNMTLTLLIITAISAASLGYVHRLTKTPKAAAEAAKLNFAIRAVSAKYDNDPSAESFLIDSYDGGSPLTCYPAEQGGEIQGVAVGTWTDKGYSGMIRLMIGFDKEGNITGISVLEQKETPGLGSRMTETAFISQFYGKNPATNSLIVKKDGGEVDAITAATISSRAFCDAVNRAYRSVKAHQTDDKKE
ncbi:MAG: RnfABCDGE type electron transport complex subunit G [Bacteroidales bacterium]|jgi:electron transport complex protein RnfG|nr:RnfABCDGE type electron transport complex subunit G [Bacteroidales bacterium]